MCIEPLWKSRRRATLAEGIVTVVTSFVVEQEGNEAFRVSFEHQYRITVCLKHVQAWPWAQRNGRRVLHPYTLTKTRFELTSREYTHAVHAIVCEWNTT